MSVTVTPQVFTITPSESTTANSIPVSIGMMKGDILVFRGDSDVVRLPVGQDGQVLVADSTSELGVKWVTLS